MWVIISGVFLGWALGANDAANVFGPAVTSNILRFSRAAVLASIFIVIGAILEGGAGVKTIDKLSSQTILESFICMISAGIVVTFMTFLKIPVSTSQAVIGAVIGAGLASTGLNHKPLVKVVICWIGTPIGGVIISFILYNIFGRFVKKLHLNFFQADYLLTYGLVFCCIYGAYALGANNVANTTGVFVSSGLISVNTSLWIGSLSIVAGVLTYSKNVIKTIGASVVILDGFSGLISLLASAITVHFYAIIGVPVSTSQAIIGAVLGIGITKGIYTINIKTLLKIFLGWLMTPLLAIIVAYIIVFFI